MFSWALLDALRNADRDGNDLTDLLELTGHVQNSVPRVSAELNSTVRGISAVPVAAREAVSDAQSARFGSGGENFILVKKWD